MGAYLRHVNRRGMDLGPARNDMALPDPVPGRRYLLYVHVPFCEVLCPFCSFHRITYAAPTATPYFAALRDEIRHYHDRGFDFSEVYFGGGTPTVNPDELISTLGLIRSLFSVERVSAETNPDHLESGRLRRLRDSGVNRLSVGVQSFDDALLKRMQRYAKYGSGEMLIERLQRAAGVFDTLNLDLIFNLPEQSEAALAQDLHIVRDVLEADQVSFYPLMAGAATRKRIAHAMGAYDHSREQAFYELIRASMTGPFRPNSAWCFSRTDGMIDEYIVDHEEYVGVGSGAFSVMDGAMYATTFSVPGYHERIGQAGHGVTHGRRFTRLERYRYHFMMTLFGLSLNRTAVRERFGDDYERVLWREFMAFRLLGSIEEVGDEYRLTERGMYHWVMMMREFLTGVDRLRDQMRLHPGLPAAGPAQATNRNA